MRVNACVFFTLLLLLCMPICVFVCFFFLQIFSCLEFGIFLNIHTYTCSWFSGFCLRLFLCNYFGHAVTLSNLCAYVFTCRGVCFSFYVSLSLSFWVKFNHSNKMLCANHMGLCILAFVSHSLFFFYSNRLDAFGTLFPFIINCIATLTAYKDYKNLFRIPFIVSALFSCPKIQTTYIIVQFDLIPLWLLFFSSPVSVSVRFVLF